MLQRYSRSAQKGSVARIVQLFIIIFSLAEKSQLDMLGEVLLTAMAQLSSIIDWVHKSIAYRPSHCQAEEEWWCASAEASQWLLIESPELTDIYCFVTRRLQFVCFLWIISTLLDSALCGFSIHLPDVFGPIIFYINARYGWKINVMIDDIAWAINFNRFCVIWLIFRNRCIGNHGSLPPVSKMGSSPQARSWVADGWGRSPWPWRWPWAATIDVVGPDRDVTLRPSGWHAGIFFLLTLMTTNYVCRWQNILMSECFAICRWVIWPSFVQHCIA